MNKNDSSLSTACLSSQALQILSRSSSAKGAAQGLACDRGGF